MKREYKKPFFQRVTMHGNTDVAAICWAYAKNGKDFYHDIPGLGYAILHFGTSNGCNGGALIVVEFPTNLGLTSEQIAKGKAYMEKRIAQAQAEAGNNAEPYKGSTFSNKVESNWS